LISITALIDFNQGNKQKKALIDINHTLIALLIEMPLIEINYIQLTSTTPGFF
jgi:hypothetical protein